MNRIWPLTFLMLSSLGCATQAPSTPAASSSPATKSAPKTTAAAKSAAVKKGNITVLEAVACRSIAERSPVEPGTTFKSDIGRIYVYTRITNDGGSDTTISHNWFFNGTKLATVTLPVKGENWRTFSSKSVQPTQKGDWKVDVVHSNGDVITSVPFKIE